MSDVFLSYLSSDRPRAASLASALTDAGWDVWWDRSILPGKTFDQVIEEELAATSCVVVAWTEDSVGSRWVRTEAAEGLDRGILVPVMFDAVEIPLAFRRIQAADLTDWEPGEPHTGFDELIAAITGLAGEGAPVVASPSEAETEDDPPARPAGPVEERFGEPDSEFTVERWQDARDQTEEIDQIGPGYLHEPEEWREPRPGRLDGQPLAGDLLPAVQAGPSDPTAAKRRVRRLTAFAVVALILIVVAVVAVFVASRPESADLATTDLDTTSYDQAVLADSPIVYWPLVADGEVELRDVVGSHDLVPRDNEETGFVPKLVAGPNGIGALDLDGSAQQRLDSTFNPNAELGTDPWTLEVWMNLEKTRVENPEIPVTLIGGWHREDPERWYLNVRGGRLCVGIGEYGQVCGLDSEVDDGEWHHIVLSYQADSGDIRLFLDASEVTLEQSPWGPNEQLTDAPIAVGTMRYEPSGEWREHWDGGVSRIAIYHGILETERIQTHHRAVGAE